MPSRKELSGFASGIVGIVVSRNYEIGGPWGVGVLSRWAHEHGRDEVDLDLLAQSGMFVGGLTHWLRAQMAIRETPAEWISSARLHIRFIPRASEPGEEFWPVWIDKPSGVPMFRAVVTAEFVDDHGCVRRVSKYTWCWDHDHKREGLTRSFIGPLRGPVPDKSPFNRPY